MSLNTQHSKDPREGSKPKFRKDWKNWQEDASRVTDWDKYKRNLARIKGTIRAKGNTGTLTACDSGKLRWKAT